MITKASKSLKENGWISTDIPSLDRVTGGGIPNRRVTLLSGAYSMGKSTIAQMVVASAQREGMNVLWFDAESSADIEYMQQCGVDLKKLDLLQAENGEQGLDEILDYIQKNKNALVVIDSIGALTTREEMEKTMEQVTIGAQARLVARFLRKATPSCAINSSAILCITHEALNITTGLTEASGGRKLSYAASLYIRLRLNSKKQLKSGEKMVGKVIIATIKKNKLAPTENAETELHYIYGSGFARNATLLEDALEKGIIVRNKASYEMDGERVAYGQEAMRQLMDNEEFTAKLKERIG